MTASTLTAECDGRADERQLREAMSRCDFAYIADRLGIGLRGLYRGDESKLRTMMALVAGMGAQPSEDWPRTAMCVVSDGIRRRPDSRTAFFTNSDFEWVTRAEACFPAAAAELNRFMPAVETLPAFQEVHADQAKLTQDDKWKVLLFKSYGEAFNGNLEAFPETAQLLSQIPQWSTAMYSVLQAGKFIPPHYGYYRGVLRYHLGIRVPENCGIRVNGETRRWEEGRSLIFDDTFEHSAWNYSTESRVVLFVDFLRPLPYPLNVVNEWVVFDLIRRSDYVQSMLRNQHKYRDLLQALAR